MTKDKQTNVNKILKFQLADKGNSLLIEDGAEDEETVVSMIKNFYTAIKFKEQFILKYKFKHTAFMPDHPSILKKWFQPILKDEKFKGPLQFVGTPCNRLLTKNADAIILN